MLGGRGTGSFSLHTGKSKKDGYAMATDAIGMMAQDEIKKEMFIIIHPGKDGRFYVGSDDPKGLVALLLRKQRAYSRLTLKQVAQRLGQSSTQAYSRYEQGRAEPTISKLTELLMAINPESFASINIGAK